MIPTVLLVGLLCGFMPRYRWWSIPVIGFIWSFMLEVWGDPTMSTADAWVVGFLFGAANAAVGVFVGFLASKLIQWIWNRIRAPSKSARDSAHAEHEEPTGV